LKQVAARAGMAKHLDLKWLSISTSTNRERVCGIRERKESSVVECRLLAEPFQVIQETGKRATGAAFERTTQRGSSTGES